MTNEHSSEPDPSEKAAGGDPIELIRSEHEAVRQNAQRSGEAFEPVNVRGESVSATIVRERR